MSRYSEHVTTLIDMASSSCLAVVFYRKGATRSTIRPRLVEPYSFVEGKQDFLINCYQREEAGDCDRCGWRFFMAHKLDAVEPTAVKFRPRRKVTLPSGELHAYAEPSPHWDGEGRKLYRDVVGDALADGELDPGEMFDLHGMRQQHKLTDDDVRFVHASIYHRCLGSVIDDGFVTEQEVEQIRFLHRAMKSLGWCVGD
jgi:hypothetical protein